MGIKIPSAVQRASRSVGQNTFEKYFENTSENTFKKYFENTLPKRGSEGLLTGRDDLWGAMTMVLVLFNMHGTISPLLTFSSLLVRFF